MTLIILLNIETILNCLDDMPDEPSALDDLLHTPQPDDRLDDRYWALGTGGR